MDIELIMNKVLYLYTWCGVLIICYLFPKLYITHERKNEVKPAEIFEKISIWIISIFLLSFVCWFYVYNFKNTLSEFIACFIITIFPVALGIHQGFKKDSKLTLEERKKIKKEIEDLNEQAI